MRTLLLAFLLVGLAACAGSEPAPPPALTTAVETVRGIHAPDKRVAIWEVESVYRNGRWIVRGRTNLPEAKADFLRQTGGLGLTDSITVLPAAELGERSYGVVNLSVANMRSQPKHSAELATQALLGMPLRVWDVRDDWYLVQSPDGYLAWLDEGGFTRMNKAEFDEWQAAERVIYRQDAGFAYAGTERTAPPVSDLVSGNILLAVDTVGAYVGLRFPDGRMGWVPEQTVLPVSNWRAQPVPDPATLLATAERYLGRPYLWGGTSGKAMDCSGFTKTVFYEYGLQLPRDASQQVHAGQLIETDSTLKNLLPGDLLFFGRAATAEKKERVWHVGIYQGDGRMIHSAGRVKVNSLVRGEPDFAEDRLHTLLRARRMLGHVDRVAG